MPYIEGQLTFIDFLGYQPVMALAKKSLFGKLYLTVIDHWGVLAAVYESAAVLGRARREKLGVLERMLEAQAPWLGPGLMKSSQERAKEHLDAFRSEFGREPHSFLEFICVKRFGNGFPELKQLLSAIYDRRRRGERDTDLVRELRQLSSKESKKVLKKLERKVSVASVEPAIRIFGREGIGFGSSFPRLTESMHRNLHENIDMLGLPVARAHGLAIPEKPIITLGEAEEEILQIVAVYTNRYWPEMLDRLDLRGCLERIKDEDR